ncbi:hypothetical protein LINPERHAP2_LOCUS27726 [Linum perenne]
MPPSIEITLHHSGVMDFSGEVPAYVGGTSQTIYIDKDEMCYYQLKLVGLDFVMYRLVQGMWYLDPARTMADGLHEIRNNSDVTNGLMSAVGDGLSITIFMTWHYLADYGADNEEGPIGSNTNSDPDSPIDNSVAPEFIHLIDDDIRTSYDEFAEALFSMGVRKTRNRVAYMEYSSGEEVDQLLVSQSAPGANLNWLRTGKARCEAVCRDEDCNWLIYGAWYRRNKSFMVRGLGDRHTCPRAQSINQATAKFIAIDFLERFRINRDWDVGQIVAEVILWYGIEVTPRHCYRAKKKAEDLLNGDLKMEYKKLRSYVAELKRADPTGLFMLEVEPHPSETAVYFKRLYVGFSSLRKGFLSGCRRMFGLDGCFLKGEVNGMLMAVVGKDENNQLFPIAWAVVKAGN